MFLKWGCLTFFMIHLGKQISWRKITEVKRHSHIKSRVWLPTNAINLAPGQGAVCHVSSRYFLQPCSYSTLLEVSHQIWPKLRKEQRWGDWAIWTIREVTIWIIWNSIGKVCLFSYNLTTLLYQYYSCIFIFIVWHYIIYFIAKIIPEFKQ